jgi:hypothetical protein
MNYTNNQNCNSNNYCGCGQQYPVVPGSNPSLQTWNGQRFVVADGSYQLPIYLPNLQQYDPTQVSNVIGMSATGQLVRFADVQYAPNNALVTATGSTTPDTLANRFERIINVKDFGAVGDGVADDTAACQAAINFALANNLGLQVSGLCYITASLIINRQVDTTSNVFCISASGTGQGFLVKAGVTLIGTTLNPITIGNAVVSEFIRFFGVHFQSKTPSDANTFVISGLFLRINFESCHFQAIKCMNFANYSQSWYFLNNTIRLYENGTFFKSVGCYDISFINNLVEGAGSISTTNTFFDSSNGFSRGLRFIGNLIESLKGSAIIADSCEGVTISSNYFEFNGTYSGSTPISPNINLNTPNAVSFPHSGLQISDNWFYIAPNGYAIYWGPTNSATTSNNYSYKNLHDNSANPSPLNVTSSQDTADGTLWAVPRGNIIVKTNIASQFQYLQGSGTTGFTFSLDITKYSVFLLSTTATGSSGTNNISIVNTPIVGQRISIYFVNSTSGGGSTFLSNAYTLPTNFFWAGQDWTQLSVNKTICINFVYTGVSNAWWEESRTSVYNDYH